MNLGRTITKNAIANLVRGGATAVVAIALPRFLTRSLDTDHFAAWSLVLQIAAYASFLDFGLQTAVARFIAQAIELEQGERQAKLVSTALVLLTMAGGFALVLIGLIVHWAPYFFHGVPTEMLSEFKSACMLTSLSACLLLPLSAYTGILIGMRRNEIPAVAIGLSRLIGAVTAIVVAHRTQSLVALSLCLGVPNLIGALSQMVIVRGILSEGRARIRHVDRQVGIEFLHFCSGLTIWSIGMLIIGGLDVTIVGHFNFSSVGTYSIASILIALFAGVNTSIFSALMAPVAALHAREESAPIRSIVFAATKTTMALNLSLMAIIFFFGLPLLSIWVGPVYATTALPILKVLAVAQTIRLMMSPYSVMLVSIGEQNRGIPVAICEASVNLLASIIGMIMFGAVGVAWGTLIGAICGLGWTFWRVLPTVKAVQIGFANFMGKSVMPGSIPFLPLAMLYFLKGYIPAPFYWSGFVISFFSMLILLRWPTLLERSPLTQRA